MKVYYGENGGGGHMEMEFIRNRITELRLKKGVSEYQLSYDLGHSKNYIHNIVTGYSQPSVKELLYLIDTLGITPRLFFDEEANTEIQFWFRRS